MKILHSNIHYLVNFPKSTAILIFVFVIIIQTNISTISAKEERVYSFGNPAFIGYVKNQTAAVGKEVIFSCSVSNIGKYKVGWLRASDKMIISFNTKTVIQNDRIAVKYEPHMEIQDNDLQSNKNVNSSLQTANYTVNGTWRLIIRHLKESDRGCYMCQINTSPMKSQLGCLDILVSPDILNNETSTDVSVVEGNNATLSCKAVGRPTPRILWKREDGQPILLKNILYNSVHSFPLNIYNGSTLNLHRVDRKQMGTYLCIASNDVHPAVSKRVTVSINFLPSVQAVNQLLGAPLGTDVVLECYVEAHPNPVNYWIKNPDEMLLEGPKYLIQEKRTGYRVSMHLTIQNFNENDVGSYSCISSNSLGKVEGISRLYRIGDFNGLVPESRHISILAGFAEAARGSANRNSKRFSHLNSCAHFLSLCIYLSIL